MADGAHGGDLSVNPTSGIVAIFMIQCSGPNLWAGRDLFLKTATEVVSDCWPLRGLEGRENSIVTVFAQLVCEKAAP